MSKVSTPAAKPATTPQQPKKIDSRTMHALIAKGAENMTGPWLCLECGVDGRPISIPAYKSFRRHLINVHRQKIDPRLCEHCGFRSIKRNDLHYHILTKHQIKVGVQQTKELLITIITKSKRKLFSKRNLFRNIF